MIDSQVLTLSNNITDLNESMKTFNTATNNLGLMMARIEENMMTLSTKMSAMDQKLNNNYGNNFTQNVPLSPFENSPLPKDVPWRKP